MPFPDVPRYTYARSPLHEVVSKFAFTTILKIEAQVPADFQDQVRGEFPHYRLKPVETQPTQGQAVGSSTVLVGEPLTSPGTMAHIFESADRQWKLVLTREKLSLSTARYTGWESFRQRLAGPTAALARIYSPGPFTHVCLRYQNLIRRDHLGLKDVSWSELVQPWVIGPLGHAATQNETTSLLNKFLITLPNRAGQVDAACGLGVEQPANRPLFVIEGHIFSNTPTEPTDALARLDRLNGIARNFFRWCITDRLHAALVPGPLLGNQGLDGLQSAGG